MSMSNISVGVNIPQTILAGLEAYVVHGDVKKALIYGGSVGLSNLIASGANNFITNDRVEKYVAEPIAAGLIADLGFSFMEKKHNYYRIFGEGFMYGASSAVVSNTVLNSLATPAFDVKDESGKVVKRLGYGVTTGSYGVNRAEIETNYPDSNTAAKFYLS